MKRFVILFLFCLVCLIYFPLGCTINSGCSYRQFKEERTDYLTSQVSSGSTLSVETDFGSITVKGADTAECKVVADITARAPTQEEAEQILQQVKVSIVSKNNDISLNVEKPKLGNNRSVGVSFDITVPENMNLNCDTSFGTIEIEDIIGTINADTSFASIICLNVEGLLHLDTSYGTIDCVNITSGSIEAESSFGSINIECSSSTPPDIKADIETSYGDILFETAPGFAGSVTAETSFGNITTDIPLVVQGQVRKDELTGLVGQGSGHLDLRTDFGSIKIEIANPKN
ncbi:MAG: hypothetical protein KAS04_05305 [Candidatus Aenigmarchaeota archaeon]|nr:hypothetical protein [Candidatus Aenigmarchaeota archaeon]